MIHFNLFPAMRMKSVLTRFLMPTFLMALTAMLLAFAPAQDPGGPPRFGPNLGAGKPAFNDSRDRVDINVLVSQPKIASGTDFIVAIVLDHQPGWHSWTNQGNTPTGMVAFDGAINTSIKATMPADSSFLAHEAFIQWPDVHAAKADVGEGPQDYAVFSDQAVIYLPVSVKLNAKPLASIPLELRLTFQSCNENMCMAPVIDLPLSVSLVIVDQAALVGSPPPQPSAMFRGFDGSVFAKIHAGENGTGTSPVTSSIQPSTGSTGGATPQAADSPRPTFFGITLPRTDGPFGLVILAMLSMLGGFILNLTPCVLPIIPEKA